MLTPGPDHPHPHDRLFGNDAGDGSAIGAMGDAVGRFAIAQARHAHRWIAWLRDHAAPGASDASSRTWERDLRPWLRFLDQQRCDTPTPATVAAYQAEQRERYRPNTVNNRLHVLERFYAWCAEQQIYRPIAEGLERGAATARQPPVDAIPDAFATAILALMPQVTLLDLRNRVIMALIGSGLETIAIHRALVGDVDVASGILHFATRAHAEKAASLTLEPAVRAAVVDYLEERFPLGVPVPSAPLVTPQDNQEKPLSTLSMRLLFKRCTEQFGIGKGRLTTSVVRAAAVTSLAARVGDAAAARRLRCRPANLRRLTARMARVIEPTTSRSLAPM
jgi:site-specific recombinase XerD